jgi:hypothetical protein
VAPNVGASTCRTPFRGTSFNANRYQITNIRENGLISGQSLFAPFADSTIRSNF